MLNHGLNTRKDDTSFSSVTAATVGIPFFIGAWPCHTAKGYAGKPQYAADYNQAKELGGYSTEWRDENGAPKWTLCQAIYSQFILMAVSPAIFLNVFDPAKHKQAVPAADYTVSDNIAVLPFDAINNDSLVVKASAESDVLVKDTDYEVYYDNSKCFIELLPGSASYNVSTLNISYDMADPSAITAEDIEAAVESVEMCRSTVGIVPDLLCAPGWSSNPTVAAVMAAKAANINGLYRAKAVVDLDTSSVGADDYSKVLECKNANGYTSEDMIVCWPMVKRGEYLFDLSVVVCGLIATVDTSNDGCPYESPSNKSIGISSAVTRDGTEITLSSPQADIVSYSDGVVTVLNNGGWVLWGNYTGCWPQNSDVAKHFICTNRMQDWICNTFVNMFWEYLDRPLRPVLIDAIVNRFNIWLNGLTSEGKLYGGEIEFVSANNPASELMGGKFKLNTKTASPTPAQQINMYAEYSIEMLAAAFGG